MVERVEYGEPIARLELRPHECRARWRHPGEGPWDVAFLSVGVLGDGRWYVDHTGQGCRGYPTKGHAWAVVRNWMRRRESEWERVPCYPTTEG